MPPWESRVRVSLLLSLWISLAARHSPGRRENEITAAVLASWNTSQLWMGRSPTACSREIQFKICTAHCGTLLLSKCMCVRVREILIWSAVESKFDSASMLHFFKHISAGLQIMLTKVLKLYSRLQKFTSLLLTDTWCIHTHTHTTNTHPFRGPRVAPSGAVVEQVVSPMGCMLNPPGASREIVPLSQEPAHKDRKWNPSTWYHSTAGPQGIKLFSMTPVMDLLLFLKRVYLGTHRRLAAGCCAYNGGKQSSVAEAVLQIRPCFREKSCKWNNAQTQGGVGGVGVIAHCCVLSNEINPFISLGHAAMEQFSLQWQPGSFSFLLTFSLMQFQSGKQTPRVLSSGSSVP